MIRTCDNGHPPAHVASGTRCVVCERRRPSRQARGYDAVHERARAVLATTLPTACAYGCGTVLRSAAEMVAAHVVDGDPTAGWVAACRSCNEHAKRREVGRHAGAAVSLRSGGLPDVVVIEKVESYGMAVGAEVFGTVLWSGRFAEAAHRVPVVLLPRRAVKLALCADSRAKDANIRQALIDRFGGSAAIGRKASPGPLYGISRDVWSALAIAVTYTLGREGVEAASASRCGGRWSVIRSSPPWPGMSRRSTGAIPTVPTRCAPNAWLWRPTARMSSP